ncbi:MAG: endopeptidase La [Betaproteobacteria bacterium]|nr:endopeptidase La [Betaproteobacteria bacterium]
MNENQSLQRLPLLPIRNAVLFPHLIVPTSVSRPSSIASVEAALAKEEKWILAVTQRDSSASDPSGIDLFEYGTLALVRRFARLDSSLEINLQGLRRVRVNNVVNNGRYLEADSFDSPVLRSNTPEVDALQRSIVDLTEKIQDLSDLKGTGNLMRLLQQIQDPLGQVYLLASLLSLDVNKEQSLLEANTQEELYRRMVDCLGYEVEVLNLREKISTQAASAMSREQREYLLRQQMRAIQQELGGHDGIQIEVQQLKEKLLASTPPAPVLKEALAELERLEQLNVAAPDYQVLRTHLELIADLPWSVITKDNLDLKRAETILDHDHYGLKEVKIRILEQLVVMKRNRTARDPILCLIGPPGVGKTSLGESIARALGRKFERMSLGGLHDEAELRGHRRTYIGSMPGRIIQAIRRSGARNPLLMLDEVDKLGRDFHGDPAPALLEILDPAQNYSFHDNYLDVPFDLSKVFFIVTANTADAIPAPLLDRMELVRLVGYTDDEKIHIAQNYLIPRQLNTTGLTQLQCQFTDESLKFLIRRFTREAGVRQLERVIGRVARKIALGLERGLILNFQPNSADIEGLLGAPPFPSDVLRNDVPPGVAAALAWTEFGGDVLYVEAVLLQGGRDIQLTGQLGDVMRESAHAARSYIWSQSNQLQIDPAHFEHAGLHIHIPAGAVPKDGPSAGVTIATALASLLTKRVVRSDTAMTGEMSLTGLILPVGGIKEKVLAAHRLGLRRVILPEGNQQDLSEVPDDVRKEMQFVLVKNMHDALSAALEAEEQELQPVRSVS